MLELAIVGLLGVSLGGANVPRYGHGEDESEGFRARVVAAVVASDALDLAARPPEAAPGDESAVLPLGLAVPYRAVPGIRGYSRLVAKLDGIACYLTQPRAMVLTPTDRAPRDPSFFLALTVGNC